MHSIIVALVAAGLATFAQAYTTPGAATWGPLLTPDLTEPITQGDDFTITWDPESHPTDGVTVSLVLCHGPSSNCVPADTAIASGIPAAQKSYTWKVPCDLAAGTQSTDTGYGMLVIVDGTGEFQYSTQFSCLANKSCSGSSGSSGVATTTATGSASGNSTTSPATTITSTASTSTDSGAFSFATGTGTGSASSTGVFSFGNGTGAPASSSASNGFNFGPTTTASGSNTGAPFSFGSATPSAATASTTFAGSAAHLSLALNGAGVVVAGAAVLFAL